MVGCVTCSNSCPTHAISFPPLDTISSLLSKPEVHHDIEDILLARKDQFQWTESIPHQDRIVNMAVDRIVKSTEQVLIVTLKPKSKSIDCFCQFMPGQYVEIWIPNSEWMSRAYSIGNAPLEDGSIEIQIRKVEGGRFSTWAFEKMKVGDLLSVRGPLGNFTVKSKLETPLLFVAGGTGFAPIKSMIEQQLRMSPNRRIVLFWGAHTFNEFYELDIMESWCKTNPNLTCILATRNSPENAVVPRGCTLINKSLVDAIEASQIDLIHYDAYVAGPPSMIPAISKGLTDKAIPLERIYVDSFGN